MFIKNRIELWLSCWIQIPLDRVLKNLAASKDAKTVQDLKKRIDVALDGLEMAKMKREEEFEKAIADVETMFD